MSQAKLPPAPAPFESTPVLEQYLDNHLKKVVILLVVAVAAMVLFAVARYKSEQKAIEAGGAFVAAKTVEDCDKVIQTYGGSQAAGNALLLKADLLWEQNKKDSSVAALKEFVANDAKHPLVAAALVSLGSKLDASGQKDEAKAAFERVVNEFATAEVAPLAQLRLGDLLLAQGKEDEAKKVYESLPAKFANADTSFLDQGESRINWINAKLPTKEVDGPPKPKVDKAAAATPPGAPQLRLNSGGTLNPTILPPGAEAPQGNPAPGAPMVITPSVAPAPAPAPGVTAPATSLPKPAPAPQALPTPAPAPAVPAATSPAPAAATPAPVPAPAASATPAPAPAKPAP